MKKIWVVFFLVSASFCIENSLQGYRRKRSIDTRASEQKIVVKKQVGDKQDLQTFDKEAKSKAIITFVERGITYFQSHEDDEAFNAFTHNKKFIEGHTYLFVFDIDGTCLAHGQESGLIWKNLSGLKDQYGVPIFQAILAESTSPQSQGWVTYQWRNATKVSYVKSVNKNGKTYIIGAGYYPHSKSDAVANLVKGAAALFNDVTKQGLSNNVAFGIMSYPAGRFVLGDLYIYALDFDGNIVGHGERIKAIGTNELDYKDAYGLAVHKEIIRRLQESKTGIWIDYVSKGAQKKAYAEKVIGKDGKEYFIACGYYPTAGRKQAEILVKKGYQYLKRHGETLASKEFSKKKRASEFVYGDLFLIAYDFNGKCIGHGGNPELVGKNQFEDQDEDGQFYIKELIAKAEEGGGWVDYKFKNSFVSVYVEKVEVGLKSYFIGSGVYPISKYETMLLLGKSGAGYLKSNPLKQSMSDFIKSDGKFIRGDLHLFVFDDTGICYMYEDNTSLIWKNLMNEKDDSGVLYVQDLIENGKQGPYFAGYHRNNRKSTVYVEPVEKDGALYVVGSVFYH